MYRWFATIILILFASSAPAADHATAPCLAKPDPSCVLDLAHAATREASGDVMALPYGEMVETASRIGRLDLVLQLLDKVQDNDTLATTAVVSAFTRADRLGDIEAFLKHHREFGTSFDFAIAPVLIELGRVDAYDRLIGRIEPSPGAEQLALWQVLGHLRAGRAAEAARQLQRLMPASREETAAFALETLVQDGAADNARPLLPFLTSTTGSVQGRRAQLATALADAELARDVLGIAEKLPPLEWDSVRQELVSALAASGAWEEAEAMVRTFSPDEQSYLIAEIAYRSGAPASFASLDVAIQQEGDPSKRDRLKGLMARALGRHGLVSRALRYVDDASGEEEHDSRTIFAAVGLAEAGKGSEAVGLAISIGDPDRRAWALAEVAAKLRQAQP